MGERLECSGERGGGGNCMASARASPHAGE